MNPRSRQWTLAVNADYYHREAWSVPYRSKALLPDTGPSGTNSQTPSSIIAAFLPDSEVNQIGATEDDISLLWLKDQSQTGNAVSLSETTKQERRRHR